MKKNPHKLAEPELAEPKLAEPELAEPKLAEPKLAEPPAEPIRFFLYENENKILTTDELTQLKNELLISAEEEDVADHFDLDQLELYYKTHYNVKALNQILTYYGLSRSKMVKDELIQLVLFFESDPLNKVKVQTRLRLWQNIKELKNDAFFGKYIMFDI